MTGDWTRLDRRTVAVTALLMAGVSVGAGLPTGIGIARSTSIATALAWVLPCALAVIIGGAAIDQLRWRKTRYRVDAERVELRSGILVHKRRSVLRERIRSVDVTADPLLRIFGLVTVRIGTGEQSGTGGSMVLRPVRPQVGEELRRVLERAPQATTDDGPLAELDPSWIRFAPLSFVGPMLGAAAFGAVMNVSEWFGAQQGVIDAAIDVLRDLPLVAAIAVLAAIALVIGTIGSLGLFVEMWWHYRLEREPSGTLRVRRGLLTTRSISVEEARVRGVELVEPLGARLAGAARVDVLATGMATGAEQDRTEHRTLLPAAPRAIADRVAAAVLREPVAPTSAVRLTGHPVAARGRRLRWALAAVLAPAAVLVLLGVLLTDVLLQVAAIGVTVLVPVAVLLALDAYRGLGHGLTGEYLVARSGAIRRSTVALQRRGIIGWTAKQSVFQRRAGLLTLTATTSAGFGGYAVRDVDVDAGIAFAEAALPDLFTPFLAADGDGDRETVIATRRAVPMDSAPSR